MPRRHIPLAVVGSILLTGPASAFDRWCFCPPPRFYCPPPVIYYAPPPVYAGPVGCPPGAPMTLPKAGELPKPMSTAPAPTIKEERTKEVAPAEFRTPPKSPAELAPGPKSGSDLATPSPAPPPEKRPDVPAPPQLADPVVPAPAAPAATEKKADGPTKPADVPMIPKLDVEPAKVADPKVPISDAGAAADPGKIPPLTIPAAPPKKDDVLLFPNAKPADPPAGGLQIPPIDLPLPAAAPMPEKKSTSGSSPLVNATAGPSVSVTAVAGSPPSSGRYAVRFFNYTDSAFKLTVESGSISLPAKHFVDVQIGRAFTWQAGAGPEQTAEIPADAKGLEIAVKP